MTVLIMLRMPGDGARLEKAATENRSLLQPVVAKAREYGVISHRFWANETEIVVVDEWPDQQTFEAFLADQDDQIKQIMDQAGVTTEPELTHWRKLATGDEVG
jgi:quinol monooxygenase YgiN